MKLLEEKQSCNECGESAATVEIGDDPDWDSHTAWVCHACLQKAAAMFHHAPLCRSHNELVKELDQERRKICDLEEHLALLTRAVDAVRTPPR